jgi:Mn2+/Fe2+ NRAMP family transporter
LSWSSTRSKRSKPPAGNGARSENLFRRLGPGIISGASDNDPSTVATLAVIGASTVYGLAWLVVLVIPMLAVVQAIAARVGAVSKKGLEDCIAGFYGRAWALLVLIAVLAVNVLTLAADLAGGSAALHLLFHVDYRWFVVPFAVAVGALLVFGRYEQTSRWLRLIPLIFLAYIAAAFFAHPDWGAVVRASIVPHLEFSQAYVSGAIALLGTTLTSYAYVWETVEVARERPPLRRLGLVQAEAVLGTVVAGITFWFIVVATGATLGAHHHEVQTAEDAAAALAPIAGPYASILFAVGLLGSALLAVPVIAGTSAYVVAETFGWRRSLDASFARAPRFYAALLISLVAGAALALVGIAPIALLFTSSIAGGIATPLTLVFLMLLAARRDVMRRHLVGPWLRLAGWVVTAVVTASAVAYLVQVALGRG